jgi:hypothetical protein
MTAALRLAEALIACRSLTTREGGTSLHGRTLEAFLS